MKSKIIYLAALLLASSLLPPASAQDKAPAPHKVNEKTALQGTWRAVAATSNGEEAPQSMLSKLVLVFKGDTFTIMGSRPTRFRVDASAKPAHIDFLNSKNQVGIYELKGDTLKICTGQDGDRPTTFVTKKYSDHTYMLLKRVPLI